MDAEESRGTEPTTIQLQSFPNNQARVIGKATHKRTVPPPKSTRTRSLIRRDTPVSDDKVTAVPPDYTATKTLPRWVGNGTEPRRLRRVWEMQNVGFTDDRQSSLSLKPASPQPLTTPCSGLLCRCPDQA
jgi:hypothetical protein